MNFFKISRFMFALFLAGIYAQPVMAMEMDMDWDQLPSWDQSLPEINFTNSSLDPLQNSALWDGNDSAFSAQFDQAEADDYQSHSQAQQQELLQQLAASNSSAHSMTAQQQPVPMTDHMTDVDDTGLNQQAPESLNNPAADGKDAKQSIQQQAAQQIAHVLISASANSNSNSATTPKRADGHAQPLGDDEDVDMDSNEEQQGDEDEEYVDDEDNAKDKKQLLIKKSQKREKSGGTTRITCAAQKCTFQVPLEELNDTMAILNKTRDKITCKDLKRTCKGEKKRAMVTCAAQKCRFGVPLKKLNETMAILNKTRKQITCKDLGRTCTGKTYLHTGAQKLKTEKKAPVQKTQNSGKKRKDQPDPEEDDNKDSTSGKTTPVAQPKAKKQKLDHPSASTNTNRGVGPMMIDADQENNDDEDEEHVDGEEGDEGDDKDNAADKKKPQKTRAGDRAIIWCAKNRCKIQVQKKKLQRIMEELDKKLDELTCEDLERTGTTCAYDKKKKPKEKRKQTTIYCAAKGCKIVIDQHRLQRVMKELNKDRVTCKDLGREECPGKAKNKTKK